MALKFSFRFNKPIFFLWKAILVEEHWMCSEADCGNGNFLVGTTYKPQTQFWYLKTHTHDVHLWHGAVVDSCATPEIGNFIILAHVAATCAKLTLSE